ncbi:hypothetical protein NDU88_001764 [Pleurodeles waltl]|uniref:Uncharacterized protein n=1 Tax=Pleurodeles waltl TaxID=8319 RepID=A0AAV7Q6X5_PLEWA|nr:hypothetical protein NDU88_001764 [Pleurodeles waltl]
MDREQLGLEEGEARWQAGRLAVEEGSGIDDQPMAVSGTWLCLKCRGQVEGSAVRLLWWFEGGGKAHRGLRWGEAPWTAGWCCSGGEQEGEEIRC